MNSRMWYRSPASEWKDGLPVGNGVLAAMVLGGTTRERLALNHEWLWRAQGRVRTIEPRHQHLPAIRERFFAGDLFEAGTLANEKLGGPGGISKTPNRVDPYQPAGDLFLDLDHTDVSDYRRELDLKRALLTVSYVADGVRMRREVIAHAARPVIVVRISAEDKAALSTTVTLSRIDDPECTLQAWARDTGLGLAGEFVEGMRFAVEARVVAAGGTVSVPDAGGAAVRVAGSDEVLILLTIATGEHGGDPSAICRDQLQDVPTDWDALLAEHVEHHRTLYDRVSLDVGDNRDGTPTDERLGALRDGSADESLLALYFNFGRYLLIASSHGCELPANLQGKWNEDLKPPWECDLHHDVNLQMNYWPAEVCNLAECLGPLFDHVERFVPHGREVARLLYDCDGIVLPIQTDPRGRATPESRGWDVWTGAAAWLAQHFWWRYEYSRDETFLRERAYPVIKEVAAFYQTYLVRDPQGRLVPVPSQSPENTFTGGTSPVSLCVGATMDLELIHDALTHAIQASEELGVDRELRQGWRCILEEIPPLQVGRYGQLQEWLEDYEECEPGHRHISHLVGLFPGDQLTLEDEPRLTQAARASLERRLAHGGGHTGWSRAWVACCWARLAEGNLAREHLIALLTGSTTDSLLDLHPPRIFQIDGNFGGTAAVAEMLLQSHHDVVRILPALPSGWSGGRVSGLRARGGFGLDITWAHGQPQQVTLRSDLGLPCRMHLPDGTSAVVTCRGGDVPVAQNDAGTLRFETDAGTTYTVRPTGA